MNEKLAETLIALTDPSNRRQFEDDPSGFLNGRGLSEADHLALGSRHSWVLRRQMYIGDLTPERIKNFDFGTLGFSLEHQNVHIADHEVEHEVEHEELSNLAYTDFGPYARRFPDGGAEDNEAAVNKQKANSLIVVGSGISVGHLTREAIYAITAADAMLYCVADPATELELMRLNPNHEDLHRFYGDGKPRGDTYREMSARIIEVLRQGKSGLDFAANWLCRRF
jgi:hypothetical protein